MSEEKAVRDRSIKFGKSKSQLLKELKEKEQKIAGGDMEKVGIKNISYNCFTDTLIVRFDSSKYLFRFMIKEVKEYNENLSYFVAKPKVEGDIAEISEVVPGFTVRNFSEYNDEKAFAEMFSSLKIDSSSIGTLEAFRGYVSPSVVKSIEDNESEEDMYLGSLVELTNDVANDSVSLLFVPQDEVYKTKYQIKDTQQGIFIIIDPEDDENMMGIVIESFSYLNAEYLGKLYNYVFGLGRILIGNQYIDASTIYHYIKQMVDSRPLVIRFSSEINQKPLIADETIVEDEGDEKDLSLDPDRDYDICDDDDEIDIVEPEVEDLSDEEENEDVNSIHEDIRGEDIPDEYDNVIPFKPAD